MRRRLLPNDGLSAMDHVRLLLGSSRLWGRTAAPLGIAAAALVVGAIIYGSASAFSARGAAPSPDFALSTATTSSPAPNPPASLIASTPSTDAPTAFDHEISVEAWTASKFAWPASGRVTQLVAAAGSNGLTIQVSPDGAVIASARGVVSAVDSTGPGLFVITVAHPDGLQTVYGNVAAPLVQAGQKIERGQVMGRPAAPSRGSMGLLGFMVLDGSQPVDPLGYLPSSHPDPSLAKPVFAACPSQGIAIDPASETTLNVLPDLIRSYSIRNAGVIPVNSATPSPTVRINGALSLIVEAPPVAGASLESGDLKYTLNVVLANGVLRRSLNCSLIVTPPRRMPAVDLTFVLPTAPAKPTKTATPRDATPTIKKPSLSAPE